MNAQETLQRTQETETLARKLAHVYWIGGSPCSGKSSIVSRLQEQANLVTYSCDEAFGRHAQAAERDTAPTLFKVTHMDWETLWMRPVETLFQDEVQVYREEWRLIVDDLLALPSDRPIVAEGAALMPGLVHGILSDPRQAIWVVPSETFQREIYPKRGDWVDEILSQCSQPEQALRNWMDRDVAFARHVSARSRALALAVLTVDGSRSIDENATIVAAQFAFKDTR